jgi:hypothetical protein
MAVILPATGSGDATPSIATYTSSAGASGVQYQQIVVRPDCSANTMRISTTSINSATSGDNALVTGTSGQTIRILGMMLVSTATQSWKFKSSTATDLMPTFQAAAGVPFSLPISAEPYFITTTGETLYILQSTSVQISGKLWFTKSSS